MADSSGYHGPRCSGDSAMCPLPRPPPAPGQQPSPCGRSRGNVDLFNIESLPSGGGGVPTRTEQLHSGIASRYTHDGNLGGALVVCWAAIVALPGQ